MIKIISILLLLAASCSVSCLRGGVAVLDILPIPIPKVDEKICSAEYIKNKYKYDCATKKHSMSDELKSSQAAADIFNKFTSRITVGGKSVQVKAIDDVYRKAKRLGNNDYYLECGSEYQIEVQISDESCWAACSQYLIASRFRKYKSQEEIVQKVKKNTDINSNMVAGDILDILRGLGFIGFEYTTDGANQLLQSLAYGQPVMIGILPESEGDIGHAVVVTGVRFSFAGSASPPCWFCPKYAFTEFTVLDPADGSKKTVSEKDFDSKIYFVISYTSYET